jgi:hypothetical protein
MNTRVKIVKRGTLELPQRSELNEKPATISSDREMAVVIKRWIADHDQNRRLKETQRWEILFKLGR